MISASFFSAGNACTDIIANKLVGFKVSGHTGRAGESIVCAAVSSACYMAANTITDIMMIDADISLDDGLMCLEVKGDDVNAVQVILHGLLLHMRQLEEQYPDKIKLQILEVQQ